MAILITPVVTGQHIGKEIVDRPSYCYLYEPLKVKVAEENSTLVYVSIILSLTFDVTAPIRQFEKYLVAELDSNQSAEFDLMAIAKDFISASPYQIGKLEDIGGLSISSNVAVKFSFTTDIITTPVELNLLPLYGCRRFDELTLSVPDTAPLTEWEYLGINKPSFTGGYPNISQSLKPVASTNRTPNITYVYPIVGKPVCGAFLIWKSRFGGWMYWGFDIFSEQSNSSYSQDVERGLYEVNGNGNVYIAPDYTEIVETRSISLKSVGVGKDQARALQGLSGASVAYLMKGPDSKLELMRVSSVDIPLSNLSNGANISVSLTSISKVKQSL